MSEMFPVETKEIKLRPYQEECLRKVIWNIEDDGKRSGAVVLPTGTGKTVIGSAIIRDYLGSSTCRKRGHKVVVITHRSEIAIQWHYTLKRFGVDSRIVMHTANVIGYEGNVSAPVVICGIATIKNRKKLAEDILSLTGLVVLDEVHHAAALGWYNFVKKCREANPSCFFLGFTATPFRSDKKAVLSILDDNIIYYLSILDAINEGWIVPLQQYLVRLEDESVSKDMLTDGQQSELKKKGVIPLDVIRKLAKSPAIVAQVAHVLSVTNADKQTLIYCIDKEHSIMVYEALKQYCPDSTGLVLGDTDENIRDHYMKAFVSGNLKWLVNCGVYTEGFDACHVQSIVLLRPTRSKVLYNQCIGRGLRPIPGVIDNCQTAEERKKAIAQSSKPSLYVCDFVGSSLFNRLVTSLHMIYQEQKDIVIEKYIKQNAIPYKEVTKDAPVLISSEEIRKRIEEQIRLRSESTRYKRYYVDPFKSQVSTASSKEQVAPAIIPSAYLYDLYNYLSRPFGSYVISSTRATDKQIAFLESLRIIPPADIRERFYNGSMIDKKLASILITIQKMQFAKKRASLMMIWAIMKITNQPLAQLITLSYYDAITYLRKIRAPWCRCAHDPYFASQVCKVGD